MRRAALGLIVVLSALSFGTPLAARQTPCKPPAPPASKQPNIFSEEQENDLGDATAERMAPDIRVIDDDAVTQDLRRIGDGLVRHLPPTKLHIQFFLIDLPEANAFVLPGGRVFVSRKLVAFAETEDELAGVIGHELGHLVARQQTIRFTKLFHDVIGVTSVGDRADIFAKYNQLMDNAARKSGAFDDSGREDGDQMQADLLGLYVVASAGYDPPAPARFWDRYAATNGRTGGFFANLFGAVSPEARRLREMQKGAARIPSACIDSRKGAPDDAYRRWKTDVVAYTGPGRKESLHGVVSKTPLAPALRGEVTHLRFSPDGRALLEQDDAGITVLTREPFAVQFRIPVQDAAPADFTPDSTHVVFHTSALRVERWSLAAQKADAASELVLHKACIQTALSPDGGILACLDEDLNLDLFDAATGAQTFQRKGFIPDVSGLNVLRSLGLNGDMVTMRFSTDGRFFAAGFHSPSMVQYDIASRDDALVYDRKAGAVVNLKSHIRRLLSSRFAFTGPDRLIAYNNDDENHSMRISLPGGDVVEQLKMFPGEFTAATKGNYLFIRPFQKYGVGVMDVDKSAVVKGNETGAIDVFDQVFVAERVTGELALYNVEDNAVIATVTLPASTLGRLHGAAVSADFKWVSVSERARGAVWDVQRGTRVMHVPGFDGGFFDDTDALFADFRPAGGAGRRLQKLDPAAPSMAVVADVKRGERADQAGGVLYVFGSGQGGDTLEARDVRTGRALWTKAFGKEPPRPIVSDRTGTIILVWPAASETARAEARRNPALARQLSALKNTDGDLLLQVLDDHTGAARGSLLVETGNGSVRIADACAAGDWVAIEDTGNRVLLYSLSTGEQKGHVFGGRPVLAPATGLLKVFNGPGHVAIYDLATMRRRDDFVFTSEVAMTAFSPDGKRLFVLTDDQTAYIMELMK